MGNADRAVSLKHASLPHQAQMETSFGQDFSSLEVYLGLGETLRQGGADALAVGEDALLFADQAPSAEQVGHELTHIVQAKGGAGTGTSRPGMASETEAAENGRRAAAGESVAVDQAAGGELQGDWLSGAIIGGLIGGIPGVVVGGLIGASLDEETPEEQIAAFRAQTFSPLINHRPSSGLGMFDVSLDPTSGALRITLKIGFNFTAGDATAMEGFRAEEFEWTEEEMIAWRADYQRDVSAMWSQQHTFNSTRDGWDAVLINTDVVVIEDSADPHFMLNVTKYPADADMRVSSICRPGTHHDAGRCPTNDTDEEGNIAPHGTAKLDSNDMREEGKLASSNSNQWVFFDRGSAALDDMARGVVQPVADTLNADNTLKIKVEGNASGDHRSGITPEEGAIENMDLARERSSTVMDELCGEGITTDRMLLQNNGGNGHDDREIWCNVMLNVYDQETQNPALHETGHMLGLGDEYPNTDDAGNPIAVDPAYAEMVLDQTGVVVDRNAKTDSAMSSGSTVEPAHYSSFLEALKTLTEMPEWSV